MGGGRKGEGSKKGGKEALRGRRREEGKMERERIKAT